MKYLHPKQAGFSLIEILVSLTIFTIVITITTGSLIVLIDSNNKAQNIQSAVNNLTFALDSMTREIRTGINYYCNTYNSKASAGIQNNDSLRDCTGGGNYLSIIEGGDSLTEGLSSKRVAFYFDNSDGIIYRRLANGDWQPITSSDVTINTMEFIVAGTQRGVGNGIQPIATIYIEGEAGEIVNLSTDFQIQTTVTQRTIDI